MKYNILIAHENNLTDFRHQMTIEIPMAEDNQAIEDIIQLFNENELLDCYYEYEENKEEKISQQNKEPKTQPTTEHMLQLPKEVELKRCELFKKCPALNKNHVGCYSTGPCFIGRQQ